MYAENWGRSSDVGIVAQVSGTDVGACWLRLLPVGVGLASVDEETPQLGIALEPEFQRKGYGQPLMLETLEAADELATSRSHSPYILRILRSICMKRCGFRKVERRNNYHLMVASVA